MVVHTRRNRYKKCVKCDEPAPYYAGGELYFCHGHREITAQDIEREEGERLFPIAQAAKEIGVASGTLRNWIRSGRMQGVEEYNEDTDKNRWLVQRSEIDRIILERESGV